MNKQISKKVLITERVRWSVEELRKACMDNDLYGMGTVRDYEEMMNFVMHSEPTAENIYLVARDILDHSEFSAAWTLEELMQMIYRRTVTKIYGVLE